jgi:glycosyltransferase involved in cell wall biosynthesis
MARAGEPHRVLWLTKGLGPGGAERLLVALAQVMGRDRFACQAAYLLAHKDHLVADLERAGVPTTCLQGSSETDLSWAGRLRRLVVEGQVDVVHSHAPYPAAVARLALCSLGRRRPALVYTEHNTWAGYGRATRWANALTYPLDDARLAVSPDALASVPRALRRNTELLVHGVDLEAVRSRRDLRQRSRDALGVGDETLLVATVANLRRHKDYPTLLGAARRVLDTGADVAFVAVGQGPLEAEIRSLADELRLGEGFHLLGYRSDPLEVLAGCDVFCLSSLAEGYPVSLMEALALGLPVVATGVGGIPDAVRPGVEGLLVPPSRPDLLADALLALAADPERRARMGIAAGERAARFDIHRAAERIQAVYEEVLSRRRQGPR